MDRLRRGREPLELTILHVNDHHSRLDAESTTLQVRTAAGKREGVNFPLCGAARVVQAANLPARGASGRRGHPAMTSSMG